MNETGSSAGRVIAGAGLIVPAMSTLCALTAGVVNAETLPILAGVWLVGILAVGVGLVMSA